MRPRETRGRKKKKEAAVRTGERIKAHFIKAVKTFASEDLSAEKAGS